MTRRDLSLNRPIALVAGGTGLVGRECLRLLSNDETVMQVRALVRRPLPPAYAAPRVRECVADFDALGEKPDWFKADWVFCALGTTMRKAGSREAFRRVDYEYPLAIAKAARAQGAKHFLVVSAMGADPNSRVFYNRVKGELEVALRALDYPSLTIARPSLLLGERGEWRIGEELAKQVTWLFPSRWRPVPAVDVAAALVHAAHEAVRGVRILENEVLRSAQARELENE
jgi:uncharacterized protein YbjT (DUF2867 family)